MKQSEVMPKFKGVEIKNDNHDFAFDLKLDVSASFETQTEQKYDLALNISSSSESFTSFCSEDSTEYLMVSIFVQ